MTDHAAPILYALFIWWFSTGVIVYLDGLPRRTFRITLPAATAVLVLALWGAAASADDVSRAGAWCGFTVGLLAWAWIELAFLTGWITGPWKRPCPADAAGLRRVGYAVAAILWHELAIIVMAVLLAFVTLDRGNDTAFWTFAILWAMRSSAKLNVFLGVRNLAEEFLPAHLKYLESFFARRPMNLLFPVSVTAGTVAAVLLFAQGFAPGASPFVATSTALLGTLLALAVLEHWFLVLPLPATLLWRWSLSARLDRAAAAEPLPGMTRFAAALETPCDRNNLASVLQDVARGAYGEVARVDGIARAGQGWVCFFVADGRSEVADFAPGRNESPRVVAHGRRLDQAGLHAAFAACMQPRATGAPA
jgi:putative photosynthetic complex assembly protein 2